MKQTLAEAFEKYANNFPVVVRKDVRNAFIAGAEWQMEREKQDRADAIMVAYMRGYEDAQKRSLWINVKDKLPEELEDVLFYDTDEKGRYFDLPFVGRLEKGENGYWVYNDNGIGQEVCDTLHWMPIPELPKGGGE